MLGERLTQLRMVLVEEAFLPDAWSRASVARVAGVSPATLARLEKTGTGMAASLAAVLAYYQAEGFNLAWVLTPENATLPLREFRDAFPDESLPRASQPLAALHRLLQPAAAALTAGQVPTPDALRPWLALVQQGILHALLYLLPPGDWS
jgi:transcriptional regulator with XRE-family HTH domain